jgi:hypothetical protein
VPTKADGDARRWTRSRVWRRSWSRVWCRRRPTVGRARRVDHRATAGRAAAAAWAMATAAWCDGGPQMMAMGEDASISDEVDLGWRDKGGELCEQLVRRHGDAAGKRRQPLAPSADGTRRRLAQSRIAFRRWRRIRLHRRRGAEPGWPSRGFRHASWGTMARLADGVSVIAAI